MAALVLTVALLPVGAAASEADLPDAEARAAVDVPAGPVVFSEIMFHPATDRPVDEYVELHNRSAADVDVAGWCIDGVDFCFEDGATLGAREYVALRRPILDGKLSNGGEELTLFDDGGAVVDHVVYNDDTRWPATADGDGPSLQRRDLTADSRNPGNWVAGAPTPDAPAPLPGTPLPSWSGVEHTVQPAPGETIRVSAVVDRPDAAIALVYRIGFDDEVIVPLTAAPDGTVRGEIPGQDADALVRYRLVAALDDGTMGTWPRQGDGSTYTGTVVASAERFPTDLPRLRWFMPDDLYEWASNDITLSGDEGYAAVFEYDGRVFDGTTVRVKGGSSRLHPKKKWNVVLPAGHELTIEGQFEEPVDEFDLHSSWVDRSFTREIVASEIVAAAGLPAPLVFPVQVERNGDFYGLYHFVEQTDGTWRERVGLDDHTVWEVDDQPMPNRLPVGNADLPDDEFAEIYERQNGDPDDDVALREMIRAINDPNPWSRRAWIDANVDVDAVVATLAANLVVQHLDYGHKNYFITLDEDGKWGTVPSDFDLTLGRSYDTDFAGCGTTCDVVRSGPRLAWSGGGLFEAFYVDTELRAMVAERVGWLLGEVGWPDTPVDRVSEIAERVRDEALRDRFAWGTWGPEDPATSARRIVDEFLVRHEAFLRSQLDVPTDS